VLGIVTALPVERRWIPVPAGSADPRIAVCGVGAAAAGEAARHLAASGVHGLASWGAAAGLDPALAPGVVLLPEYVVEVEGVPVSVDAAWRARLIERLRDTLPVSGAPLGRAPRLLASPAAKTELRLATGAAAADMESAAVAAVAAAAGVPFLAARVVLDDARLGVPASLRRAFGPGPASRAAWLPVAAHPREWFAVARLARAFLAARHSMRRVWRLGAPDLALDGTGTVAARRPGASVPSPGRTEP
jgi:adenosylhomocysteine nucleosidase